MMRALIVSALVALALVAPWGGGAARAQEVPATLVADRVELRGETLVATGSVEVFRGTDRLTAQRITYDGRTGALAIEGPLRLTSADGSSVILADAAELSGDLRDGILRSARLVLEDQLQIAATRIERIDGRYTRLSNTVASSCEVCAARPVPLWQIRASEIIHDEAARQIYFRNARFEIAGVPVLWLPRLRFPDPTLERATGFLTPSIRSTDALGVGVKLPYFIRIGDHADLTLTPYLSTGNTRTLEARYRQAFRSGSIEVEGAVTSDDIRPDITRSYLFAQGAFALPRGYVLTFDIETVRDDGYLLDYGYSDKDRLDSAIEVSRYGARGFTFAGLTGYRSLRADEDNDTIPTLVLEAGRERRFVPDLLGGIATARLEFQGHYRRSERDMDGPDADNVADGRDVASLSAALDWRRDWVLGPGVLMGTQTAVSLTHQAVWHDAGVPDPVTRAWGAAAVDLRWPLTRSLPGGGRLLLEPLGQIAWSQDSSAPAVAPAANSLLEFDEGNLLALDRFPSSDRAEVGLRANLGLRLRHDMPGAYRWDVTVARIWRDEDSGQFAGSPALDGQRSDWLAGAALSLPGRFAIANRALFDSDLQFSQNELRIDWQGAQAQVSGAYLWLRENALANRPSDISELKLDAEYRIDANWATSLDYRFDIDSNRAAQAEIGLRYRNDCIAVDLSLSRRFTSSTNVRPTTDFGLEVQLIGFGGSGARGPGACSG